MLSSRMLQNKLGGKIMRHFYGRSFASQESKPTIEKPTAEKPIESSGHSASSPTNSLANMIAPTDFDKKVMVWVKKYPSVDKVPERITLNAMQQARTRARVKVCNYMIFFFALGFLITSFVGRKAVEEGDSVMSRGMEMMQKSKESKKYVE